MDRLRQDVRTAVRSLIKSPLITLAAVLSLGLGIGANASIFSAVDVFMVRPLDFEESDNLVVVWTSNQERGWSEASSSVPDYRDWRTQSRSMELAAWGWTGVNLTGTERPERLDGYQVTSNFFDVLGRRPVLGRGFTAEEEQAGGARVVILGDGLWQSRYGADPDVIGRVISLDGEPYEVIGVMPPRVRFGQDPQVWMPIRFTGEEPRGSRWLNVLGRIRPGFELESARAELNGIQSRLAAEYPASNAGNGANIMRLKDDWFDEGFKQGSLIASTAVLFVLLIACANVANLLLARAAAREREIALRGALGARRGRILRQLLTESVILALVGGGLGLVLSVVGIRGLRGLFPADMPGVYNVTLNGRVLFFTAAVSILSGLFFGLAPALRSTRLNLRNLLTDGGRGNTATRGARVRNALIVAEISLAFVLLVCSALLVQAFIQLRTAELGFRTDNVVTLNVTLPQARYTTPEHASAFQTQLLDRIAALPGVQAVAAADRIPMSGTSSRYYTVPDEAPPEPGREPVVAYRMALGDYLGALDIALRAGRPLLPSDTRDAPRVLLVNERMAEHHWPGQSAVGKRLRFGTTDYEIVGVVGDTRDWGPDEEPPRLVYFPMQQWDLRAFTLLVHTTLAPEAIAESIRETVRGLDPDQPIHNLSTLEDRMRDQLSGSLAMTKVLASLAVIAFLLSAVGVYGVMAYSVTQRQLEMGIRMALGAQRGTVLGIVMRRGGLITGLGIGIGLLIALGVTRMLSFFLFGVSPFSPIAFTTVPVLLAATGLIASWLPALRATRVSPMTALRSD